MIVWGQFFYISDLTLLSYEVLFFKSEFLNKNSRDWKKFEVEDSKLSRYIENKNKNKNIDDAKKKKEEKKLRTEF